MNERAREAQRTGWTSIENLLRSEIWREIVDIDPVNLISLEEPEFPTFDLDGIRVYARIDLAYAADAPTIVDWKTGTPEESDRRQLALYSLYAQSKWGWEPTQTSLVAVHLQPELTVARFTPTLDDIHSISAEVKRSFSEMAELEPAFGDAEIDDFPPNADRRRCEWCRFRGLCTGLN